jgi:hypothetical protein
MLNFVSAMCLQARAFQHIPTARTTKSILVLWDEDLIFLDLLVRVIKMSLPEHLLLWQRVMDQSVGAQWDIIEYWNKIIHKPSPEALEGHKVGGRTHVVASFVTLWPEARRNKSV